MTNQVPSATRTSGWRLLRLGVVLCFVLYLQGLLVLLDASLPSYISDEAFMLSVLILLLPILALGAAAAARSFRSFSALLLFSAAIGLLASLLLLIAGDALDHDIQPQFSPQGLIYILREVIYAYWLTIATAVALTSLAILRPDTRPQLPKLVLLPVLVWGLDATHDHLLRFEWSRDPSHFLSTTQSGAITSVLALVFLCLALALIVRKYSGVRLGFRYFIAVVLISLPVLTDWVFSLVLVSIWLQRM